MVQQYDREKREHDISTGLGTGSQFQKFLKSKNIPFFTPKQWPAASPDLNPLDYSVWGLMRNRMANKNPMNIKDLKDLVKKEWDNITQDEVERIVDSLPSRLTKLIEVDGKRFE